jgi:hypothetical protein
MLASTRFARTPCLSQTTLCSRCCGGRMNVNFSISIPTRTRNDVSAKAYRLQAALPRAYELLGRVVSSVSAYIVVFCAAMRRSSSLTML